MQTGIHPFVRITSYNLVLYILIVIGLYSQLFTSLILNEAVRINSPIPTCIFINKYISEISGTSLCTNKVDFSGSRPAPNIRKGYSNILM